MNNSKQQTVLLTNDDGVQSPLLMAVVASLSPHFDLRVVAPAYEQSWIGKAISRRGTLRVDFANMDGVPTWAVHGTPADCVNLALGNLFAHEDILAVVSGVNIGYNASLATVLSSGTVGAALEAALMGKPAIALSKALPPEWFELLQRDRGELPQALSESLKLDCARIPGFIDTAVSQVRAQPAHAIVHNYNFPWDSDAATLLEETPVAATRAAALFEPDQACDGSYVFRYQHGENMDRRTKTDLNCLKEGHISYGLIDFTRLTHLE